MYGTDWINKATVDNDFKGILSNHTGKVVIFTKFSYGFIHDFRLLFHIRRCTRVLHSLSANISVAQTFPLLQLANVCLDGFNLVIYFLDTLYFNTGNYAIHIYVTHSNKTRNKCYFS